MFWNLRYVQVLRRICVTGLQYEYLPRCLPSTPVCTVQTRLKSMNIDESNKKSHSRFKNRTPLHYRQQDEEKIQTVNRQLQNVLDEQAQEDSFGNLSDYQEPNLRNKKASGLKTRKIKNSSISEYAAAGSIGNQKTLNLFGEEAHAEGRAPRIDGHWADTFGTLSDEKDEIIRELEYDEMSGFPEDEIGSESDEPYRRLTTEGRRYAPAHYGRKIEKLAKRGRIAEAIDVLETEMLKEHRVMPNQYVFTTLIGCLGRVGYTKKAFSLFNKMKKMGLQPEDPTYTALFNACANSPFPEEALQQCKNLRQLMVEKQYSPNGLVYLAMMKAYGMCGDVLTAFEVMDEMVEAGNSVNESCFHHLLVACISDKEAGFKHAIEVWRRMRKNRITPSLTTYNLLLRASRDCGAGSPEFANQLIEDNSEQQSQGKQIKARHLNHSYIKGENSLQNANTLKNEKLHQGNLYDSNAKHSSQSAWWNYQDTTSQEVAPVHSSSTKQEQLPVSLNDDKRVPVSPMPVKDEKSVTVFDMMTPNILNPRGKFREVVTLGDLGTPSARLTLLGGVPGILSHMAKDGAKPDIRTFMLLLDLVPSSRATEADILAAMNLHGVCPDIDILNRIIRKRNLRKDFSGAKEVLSLITRLEMIPNMQTYACLAMGCRRKEDGMQLLKDMEEMEIVPVVEIFNILIYQSYQDYKYKLGLIRKMKELKVKPEKLTLEYIESQIDKAKEMVVKKEKGKQIPDMFQGDFSKHFGIFMVNYKPWLLSMDLEPPLHPWDQFQTITKSSKDLNMTAS